MACGAAFDILPYEVGKTWPPELSGDQLSGLEITRMPGGLMVMTPGEDRTTEGVFWGDVDTTFVCEDMVIILPVRETRPESGRDVFQGQL